MELRINRVRIKRSRPVSDRGFDPRTYGLWAQHASTVANKLPCWRPYHSLTLCESNLADAIKDFPFISKQSIFNRQHIPKGQTGSKDLFIHLKLRINQTAILTVIVYRMEPTWRYYKCTNVCYGYNMDFNGTLLKMRLWKHLPWDNQ